MDSLVGDLVAELVAEYLEGDDDDYMGEVGRLRGRRKRRKADARLGRTVRDRTGMSASEVVSSLARTNPFEAANIAKAAEQQAAQLIAQQTGMPQTVGRFVAATGQRKETLHLGFATLAAAATSVQNLQVNVQRGIQTERLILQCADSTTGTDQLFSVGISNVVLGAHNLLATPGVVGAGTAYSRDSFGADIMSVPIGQGGIVRVDFTRIATTANPGVIAGTIVGVSAQG